MSAIALSAPAAAAPHPASLPCPRCSLCGATPAPFAFAARGQHVDELRACLAHRADVDRAWTYDHPLTHPETADAA